MQESAKSLSCPRELFVCTSNQAELRAQVQPSNWNPHQITTRQFALHSKGRDNCCSYSAHYHLLNGLIIWEGEQRRYFHTLEKQGVLDHLTDAASLLPQYQLAFSQCFGLQRVQPTPTVTWSYHQHKFVMCKHFHMQSCWQSRWIALNQTKVQVPVQRLLYDLMRIENSNMQSHLRIAGAKTGDNWWQEIHPCGGVRCQGDFARFHIT